MGLFIKTGKKNLNKSLVNEKKKRKENNMVKIQ